MKKSLLLVIRFYQRYLSVIILQMTGVSNACRFSPTCSEYAFEAITKYGVIKGLTLTIRRLLQCQPFGKAYDRAV
jgi:uncharacterized protein